MKRAPPWVNRKRNPSPVRAVESDHEQLDQGEGPGCGAVDGGAITGSLWYEPQANALVKAELNVPAALYDPTDKSLTGALKVNLNTQKANVPLVTLPSAPAGTAKPSATPKP